MFRKRVVFLVTLLLTTLASSWAAAGPAKPVAVLSFENLTGDAEHEWVALGFADTLTEKLAGVSGLLARDRRPLSDVLTANQVDQNSVGPDSGPRVAQLLAVDYLVTGSVQVSGDLAGEQTIILATARVIDARTAEITRTLAARGPIRDLFRLQEEMAIQLAEGLAGQLTRVEREYILKRSTKTLDAYKFYILGNKYLDAGQYDVAIQMYENAMAKHVGIFFAEAHHNQGTAFLRAGRKEEMLQEFQKDAAQVSTTYYDLGIAYEKNGLFDKAIKAYQTFLRYPGQRTVPWKTDGFANPSAPPAVAGKILFIGQGSSLYALSTDTGRYLWSRGLQDAPVSTPIHAGETVCVITATGALQSFDAETGSPRWTYSAGMVRMVASGGADLLLALADGRLVALAGADGRLEWERSFEPGQIRSLQASDRAVLVGTEEGQVAAVDPETGRELWRRPGDAALFDASVAPAAHYLVHRGTVQRVAVETGEPLWPRPVETPVEGEIAATGGCLLLVGADGAMTALNGTDGAREWGVVLGETLTGKPVLRGDTLLAGTERGVLGFDRRTGQRRWVYGIREELLQPPVYAGEAAILFAADGTVMAVSGFGSDLARAEIDAYLRLGRLASLRRQYQEALRLYEYVVEQLQFNCAQAHYEIAALADRLHQAEKAKLARQHYQEVIN